MDTRLEQIARVNYWDGNKFDNGIERELYLNRILPFVGNRVIKVITGQRRAGKSYLMRQIISSLIEGGAVQPKQVLYINKEFYKFQFLQTADDFMHLFETYCREINPEEKSFVFCDEIHSIPRWEQVVDSLSQDPSIDCEVFVTGSNSKLLSSELSTLLSGRYVEFEVQPFSYKEYLRSINTDKPSRQTMVEYLRTGGLPEFLNLRGEETRRNYVESVKNTILLKDIVERHNIKDSALLERILSFLVNNSSSLVSIGNIVNYLNNEQQKKDTKAKKQNYETVSSYIDFLQEPYIILKADRYDIKGKEILKGAAKYYANDNCYHNYLYEGFGYGQGALLENYIYQALRRTGYKVYVGKTQDLEVDFVCVNQDRRIYVQSCWTMDDENTAKREYQSLESIRDNFPKIIVTMDDIPRKIHNGIENIQAWMLEDWLKL